MTDGALPNESVRLEALRSYDILDTEPEDRFDRIVRITREVFDAPVAKLNLIDRTRTWPMAASGTPRIAAPRHRTFCNETIAGRGPLIIENALEHPKFRNHPLVVNPPHYRFYAGMPLQNRQGLNLGVLCCMDFRPRVAREGQIAALYDLAQTVVEAMELRLIARSDSLTGTLTRGGFVEIAKRDVALALRHGRPLSCVMFDVDHFKSVNDTHGHASGDEVLRRLTALCQSELRRSDYLGRIGGEEFAIILRETDAASAFKVADRLREAMARELFANATRTWRVTASFGVAALTPRSATVEALLCDADAALYAAKAAGRNRTMAVPQSPLKVRASATPAAA